MSSIVSALVIIGVLLVGAGTLGSFGPQGLREADADVASALALLVTYAFVIISFTSMRDAFSALCNGIPFVDMLEQYGSLKTALHAQPLRFAGDFLDVVILSTLTRLLSMFVPLDPEGRKLSMTRLFSSIVLALLGLLLINTVIHSSGPYQYILSGAGAIISVISAGSIPFAILYFIKRKDLTGLAVLVGLCLFSQNRAVRAMRGAFFQALVYVYGIYMLETRFSALDGLASSLSTLAVAFGPVLIMLFALVFLVRRVFR